MRILVLMLICAAAAAAQDAKVYRWVDDKGVIHYTDQPPTKNAKPVELPPLQTFRGTPAPASRSSTPAPAKVPPPVQVRIVAPQPDEIFRDGERQVTVGVGLAPPALGELRLMYYLDGQAATPAPVAATSLVLQGVERGSHSVAVAVVDAGGRELARAGPVVFHMKQPTVDRPKPKPKPQKPPAAPK